MKIRNEIKRYKMSKKIKIKWALLLIGQKKIMAAFYSFFFFNEQFKLCSCLQMSWT